MHGSQGVNSPSPKPGTPAGSIQISPGSGLHLRPGQTVLLTVIKQLAPGKWAVGISGRVYPAFSKLALDPGAVLRARVSADAGRFVLKIIDTPADPVHAALQRVGLPTGEATVVIARALAASGLPIRADMIERVRSALTRSRLPGRHGARLAAELVGKGIEPSGSGADSLMAVLAFGEKGGGDPRRYKKRPFPGSAAAVRRLVEEVAAEGSDKPSALQLFNHLKGKSQTWVVVPFHVDGEKEPLAGTIKLLYDPFLARPLRMALTVNGVSFFLPLDGKARKLRIFCDDPRMRRAAEQGLDSLRSKFNNMGMEVDDTIGDGEAFDGFSPIADEAFPASIDEVG